MISSYRQDKSPFPASGGGSDAAPNPGGASGAPDSGRASGVAPDSGGSSGAPDSGRASGVAPDSGGSSGAPESGQASGEAPDSGRAPAVLRYFDLVLVVVAAPILLLIGVPAVGYGVGAGAWLVLRVLGVAFEHYASHTPDARREISLRLAYLLARIFLLALAVILVRRESGRDAGLTTLLVIVFAFTIQLVISFLERPRRR